jgi:hypothetical protein
MALLQTDTISEYVLDDRYNRRRTITSGAAIVLRRGLTGTGPDLAIGLVDVNPDGIGVLLNASVIFGDEVEVELTSHSLTKPLKVAGEVRWSMAVGDGTYRAGIKLGRRLTPTDIANLIG